MSLAAVAAVAVRRASAAVYIQVIEASPFKYYTACGRVHKRGAAPAGESTQFSVGCGGLVDYQGFDEGSGGFDVQAELLL